ncbi:hypothetical protein OSF85_002558 [Enterococcus faecium]|nr:hypothetical protein [Enterococcus faecium]
MKIVYFDEGTVNDYLTILNKGILVKTDEKSKSSNGSGKVEGKFGVSPTLSKVFGMFFTMEGNAAASYGKSTEKIMKRSISNALLSDFLEYAKSGNSEKNGLVELEKFRVSPMMNSIAYYQTISPYLSMTEGNIDIGDGLSMSINKMYEALKFSKGYYEMIAEKDDKQCIFRFNNSAFSNNYSISDLEQMELLFYGFKVGSMDKNDLDFQKYMAKKTEENKEVLTVIGDNEIDEKNSNYLDVFDIVFAGVIAFGEN